MGFKLIAIGDKMPAWVNAGFKEYQKRLAPPYELQLVEIPLSKHQRPHNITAAREKEALRMLAQIPKQSYCIALEAAPQQFDTPSLADKIPTWLDYAHDITLLIGGPEGLHPNCLKRANSTWSLSRLTFAHPLVRVIVAEQLYRAVSIILHHPYHK